MDIKFGQSVKVSCQLIRSRKYIPSNYGSKTHKFWKTHQLDDIRSGIFLGYRTLSNGNRTYYSDEGYIYAPIEYFK